jgi:DNA-binding beta-propeller fold protein YncE
MVRWNGLIQLITCATAGLLISGVAGCAAPDHADKAYHPVWPPPPAQPRIRHVLDIRTPDDLHKPSALEGLGRMITGGGQQVMLRPHCVTVTADDLLCITDQEWQGVHMIRMRGSKSRFVARATDEVHFVSPVGIAPYGNLIAVSDSALNSVFLITKKGEPAGQIQKPGGFTRPTGLAYDHKHDELYVIDTLGNEVCVFSNEGELVRRFGTQGIEPGQFNYPTHVFVDHKSRIFVTDSMNFRVQVFDRDGNYLFDLGKHGDASGFLAVPKGVGVDTYGHIYIVDSYFSNIQVFDEQGRFLLSVGGPGDGIGQFQVPSGLFVGRDNRVYICDSYNRRVQVLEYLPVANHGDAGHESDSAPDR